MVTSVSPMGGHTWELSQCVAYIPIFTAAKAAKQSAGLWPVRMPVALISNGSLPFMKDGKAADPSTVAHDKGSLGTRAELSLAHCFHADKGNVNKTSILGHFKIKRCSYLQGQCWHTVLKFIYILYIYLF